MSVNDPVLHGLHKKLRVHIDSVVEVISQGNCANFPEYTKQTGILRGLELVESDLLSIDEKLNTED